MESLLTNPLLWIALTVFSFSLALKIKEKTSLVIFNPLLTSAFIVYIILKLIRIDFDTYNLGGNIITMLLGPVTVVLAIPIYRQRNILVNNFMPIICGTVCGSVVSIVSVIVLCELLGVDDISTLSLIPKSVTTAIGLELSALIGGDVSISMLAIVISGVVGAVFTPTILKWCHIDNSIAKGIALGTTSHAIGTSRAIELGEVEGAMSGIAIGIAGIVMVILTMFL